MSTLTTRSSEAESVRWTAVCTLEQIQPGGGVCALLNGEQVAVFRLGGRAYALGNHDPFTGVGVLSRGLTGSYTAEDGQTRFKVASPLLKHTFDLETGQCLSEPLVRVPVYPLRLDGGSVWIGLPD